MILLKKLIWVILTLVTYFLLCAMLELPMTSVVFSLTGRQDPNMVTAVTLVLGFFAWLYLIYLKRLRNDSRRRTYLTDIRRRYGSFKTDVLYTVKTKDFRWETVAFGVVVLFWAIRWTLTGKIPAQPAIWLLLLATLPLGVLLFAGGNLLILNKVHKDWLAALKVSEYTDEEIELQHKHRTMKRNLIIQFLFSLSFFIIYLYNTYLVTFSVVVTPALFLYSHVQSIMGIIHLRDIDQPYKAYLLFHCLSLIVYVFSLMFGVFAPK